MGVSLVSNHIKIEYNSPILLVQENITRTYLKVHNSEEHGTSIIISSTRNELSVGRGRLHPGEELVISGPAAGIRIWCRADDVTYVDVIEVVST